MFGIEENKNIEKSGVSKVFTPHLPVQIQKLLFGRTNVVKQIINQLNTPGAFPILFGERGVGKTSIAYIVLMLMQLTSQSNKKKSHYSMKRCLSKQTLSSIFKKTIKRMWD